MNDEREDKTSIFVEIERPVNDNDLTNNDRIINNRYHKYVYTYADYILNSYNTTLSKVKYEEAYVNEGR